MVCSPPVVSKCLGEAHRRLDIIYIIYITLHYITLHYITLILFFPPILLVILIIIVLLILQKKKLARSVLFKMYAWQEYRLCLQYWLGLRMVSEGTRCPVCNSLVDPFGDHQVGCGGNGD